MNTWQKLKAHPELISRYLVREQVIDGLRSFFKGQGFHEVETPILVKSPGTEPNLDVFSTTVTTATGSVQPGYLITSPEYSLKKLLAAGLGNLYQITKVFRNAEGLSPTHNHEFTLIEWYRTPADYLDIMADVEQLFLHLVKSIRLKQHLNAFTYQHETYDLTPPWPRLSVAEAFQKFAHIDADTLLDPKLLATAAVKKGYQVTTETTWEQFFYQIFFNDIEPALKASHRPCFLFDYPVAQAALSKKKADDPRFAERFEVFLAGMELGNAFSELTDWREQEVRLKAELKERQLLGKTKYPLDTDFIKALKSGMPESAGIAMGIDRLDMLIADAPTIQDTLFFPISDLFELK